MGTEAPKPLLPGGAASGEGGGAACLARSHIAWRPGRPQAPLLSQHCTLGRTPASSAPSEATGSHWHSRRLPTSPPHRALSSPGAELPASGPQDQLGPGSSWLPGHMRRADPSVPCPRTGPWHCPLGAAGGRAGRAGGLAPEMPRLFCGSRFYVASHATAAILAMSAGGAAPREEAADPPAAGQTPPLASPLRQKGLLGPRTPGPPQAPGLLPPLILRSPRGAHLPSPQRPAPGRRRRAGRGKQRVWGWLWGEVMFPLPS